MARQGRRRGAATAAAVLVGGLLAGAAFRSCARPALAPLEPAFTASPEGARPDGSPRGAASGAAEPFLAALPAPSPAAGWEEAAEAVTLDLRRILDGRPRAGAYEEARAEAARADLALFPPARDQLRRLLLGSERERVLALAALAARPELDDELVRLVLRSQRPEDDETVRLLGAEIAAGLAPDVAARHEDDLLRAFEAEPNPLVLAVALPALERLDARHLRALLRAHAAAATPEMLPVLLALARARLDPAAVEALEESLAAAIAAR